MDAAMTQPIVLLLRMIFDLVIIFLLMRFSLQLARADFYNPVSQAIVRVTNPVLVPLRRVIPPIAGQDSAALVLAYVLALLFLLVAYAVSQGMPNPLLLLLLAPLHLLEIILDMLFWGVIIHAILSWFPNAQGAPAARVLDQLITPILAPIRRMIPDLGGIDLSPIALLLVLQVLKISVVPILVNLLV
ncbi:MAG TPA: YggT family protein [bacterium]|nr:YggT family protein [bacterium]